MRFLIPLTLATLSASAAEVFSYWIEPCHRPETACEPGDVDLAEWALRAWESASGGVLRLERAEQSKARIRVFWAGGRSGLYGEARPITVEGQSGAEVHVRPDLAQLGGEMEAAGRRDRLLRDTIVYLTCLHETGHALGLPHTRAWDDIMYSFQHGGDIPEYFGRYRRKLTQRTDIRKHSGISPADRARLIEVRK